MLTLTALHYEASEPNTEKPESKVLLVEASTEGPEVTIVLHAKRVLDFLNATLAKNISIELTSSDSCVLFRPLESELYRYILMPMRKMDSKAERMTSYKGRRRMQQIPLFSDLAEVAGAVIIDNYRYLLWRTWDFRLPRALFIMLNPSTADATQNDPTLRRCIGFAKSWACGSLEVVNLFAFRSTDPAILTQVPDPVGPENDTYTEQAIARASHIVCAWGAHKHIANRYIEVLHILEGKDVYCLGWTKEGLPRHPLYVPANTALLRYP